MKLVVIFLVTLCYQSCQSNASKLSKLSDSSTVGSVYFLLGPEDQGVNAKGYISVISAPLEIYKISLCDLDTVTGQCATPDMQDLVEIKTQIGQRKLFQTKSGLSIVEKSTYLVHALDQAGNILFKASYTFAENQTPSPSPSPSPTPNGKEAPNLGSNDFELSNSTNQTVRLSAQFGEADYLWIDGSRNGCPYCDELVNLVKQNKAMFQGNCKQITVIPVGDPKLWTQKHGVEVGEHTFEVDKIAKVITAFGAAFRGTPGSVVIDRKGKKITEFEGAQIDSFLRQTCK